ncbi:MAG: prenyltransferase/squalene oxidase repeat-containing protein [Ginsengibacter sp.]
MKIKILSTVFIFSCGIFVISALESWMHKPTVIDNLVIKQSAAKGLQLLQKSSYAFTNNSRFKCASCHHNTLTAMAIEIATRKGVPVIDSLTVSNGKAMEDNILAVSNPNLINQFLPISFAIPYLLMGMHAEKYPANMHTDISVDFVMGEAKPNGSFLAESGRVPLETGDIHLTSMAIRSIQLYASAAKKKQVDELVTRTKHWLEQVQTNQQQELAFQLLGLQWCGSNKNYKIKIAEKLRAMQNEDGGWSQLPTLKSDAYATGQTLYALYESGMEQPEDAVYQKGLNYLLKTQDENGAWFIATRSFPIQPFVSSDFPPYDDNQFISAAGSNWAVMALLNALPDKSK